MTNVSPNRPNGLTSVTDYRENGGPGNSRNGARKESASAVM